VPELAEVEYYRRAAATVVGRRVERAEAPDAWFVKGGATTAGVVALLEGAVVTGARRRGKLLVLDLQDRPPLGLRFGMTGRLVVDGTAAVEELLYSSNRSVPEWERLRVAFRGGGSMVLLDPRRLGGIEIDPAEDALGPDAASVTVRELRVALTGSQVALKARLMDQTRLAGIGNLTADEVLWRVGLLPMRPSASLDEAEVRRLQRGLRTGIALLVRRGGSHTGDLMPHRVPGGRCPRDGAELLRGAVGGRTTWWCPRHQH
jgi:formamidopyrimidine-DNA glycosylase